jgi:hypothetical protein
MTPGENAAVHLREYLERIIEDLDRRIDARFLHMERSFDSAMAALAKALELQAVEYERRLSALNGEAGRIARIASESVSKELFDSRTNELRALFEARVGETRAFADSELRAVRTFVEAELKTIRVTMSAFENWKAWVIGATVAAATIGGLAVKKLF